MKHGSGLSCIVLVVLLVLTIHGTALAQLQVEWDLGGETVRIFSISGGWYDPDPRREAHIRQVEELFNVDIEFVRYELEHGDDIAPLVSGILAGEAPVDVIDRYNHMYPHLAISGYLHNLDDYMDEDYWQALPNHLQIVQEELRIFGSLYGFPMRRNIVNPRGIIWNKSMVERAGLPSVHELLDADEWTWQNFRMMAEQLTQDTTGDGEIDQWGYQTHYHGTLPLVWARTNGAEFLQEVDGRATVTLNTPETLAAFDFVQSLFEDGLVNTSGWPMEPGNVAFIDMYYSISFRDAYREPDEHGLAPMPMGPNATEHFPLETSYMQPGIIPITVEHDPRAIMEIVHALERNKDPYIEELEPRTDRDEWEEGIYRSGLMGVSDQRSFEVWKWTFENGRHAFSPELWSIAVEAGLTEAASGSEAFNQIYYEGDSPARVLASFEPVMQGLLDERLGQ